MINTVLLYVLLSIKSNNKPCDHKEKKKNEDDTTNVQAEKNVSITQSLLGIIFFVHESSFQNICSSVA